jgi:hypothetical protein
VRRVGTKVYNPWREVVKLSKAIDHFMPADRHKEFEYQLWLIAKTEKSPFGAVGRMLETASLLYNYPKEYAEGKKEVEAKEEKGGKA